MPNTRVVRTALTRGVVLTLALASCNGQPATTSAPPPTATTTTTAPASTTTATAVAPTTSTTMVPPVLEHRVGVRVVDGKGEFYDRTTDEPFVVRGVNYVFFEVGSGRWSNEPFRESEYDPARVLADFVDIAGAGFNTVRVFIDHCSSPPGCITSPERDGLEPGYLDNVADLLDAAAATGLFVLFTSNDIPDFGGYGEAANAEADADFAGYRNAHYLTASGHDAAVAYWDALLGGLADRGARFDHVLAWALLNEQWLFGDQPPLSLGSGVVTTADGLEYDMADHAAKRQMVASNLNRYAHMVHDTIEAHDPTALVTMGFFSPQFPNPTAIGGSWYVDTVSYIEGGAPFDFYEFHAYPGEDITLEQMAENFGVHLIPDKPVVLGEYGPFIDRYGTLRTAARAVSDWITESCRLGFDGWLYWSYRTNPTVGDSTWSLTSEDGFLLDLLAPTGRPDPCSPLEIATPNLAFGAPVRASASIPEEPAEAAVDEDETTQWGAGTGPAQWIEISIDPDAEVSAIRLLVAQWPEGATTHRLLIDQGSGFELLHTFAGTTAEGTWLEYRGDDPLTGVARVRVETVASPSWVAWKEIEILAD